MTNTYIFGKGLDGGPKSLGYFPTPKNGIKARIYFCNMAESERDNIINNFKDL
jgi:hypothetical protein